jgi:ribonuclease HII
MSTEQFQSLMQQAKQLSHEERKQLMECLAKAEREELLEQSASQTNYLALFGSGRGSFTSPEEAEQFIREERDSWDN